MEAKVIFDFKDKLLAMDLISDIFYDLGLQGVVVEEAVVDSMEDWGDDPIIPDHDAIIGYLPCDDELENRRKTIEKNLAKLERTKGIISSIAYSRLDEADWTETWKGYFYPEKITDNIVVKPTWRDYSQDNDEIVLEIDPGMAFGTGTHPTTSMCIAMIEKYLKKGDCFLDVGTGSGILMIAAAKLGAKKVWGTDNDEIAVDVARKNLVQNGVSESTFEIVTGNLVENVFKRFDLVSANLTSKAILLLLEDIHRVLAQGGILVCSGMIETDKDTVLEKIDNFGFEVIETRIQKNWVVLVCRPNKGPAVLKTR